MSLADLGTCVAAFISRLNADYESCRLLNIMGLCINVGNDFFRMLQTTTFTQKCSDDFETDLLIFGKNKLGRRCSHLLSGRKTRLRKWAPMDRSGDGPQIIPGLCIQMSAKADLQTNDFIGSMSKPTFDHNGSMQSSVGLKRTCRPMILTQ